MFLTTCKDNADASTAVIMVHDHLPQIDLIGQDAQVLSPQRVAQPVLTK